MSASGPVGAPFFPAPLTGRVPRGTIYDNSFRINMLLTFNSPIPRGTRPGRPRLAPFQQDQQEGDRRRGHPRDPLRLPEGDGADPGQLVPDLRGQAADRGEGEFGRKQHPLVFLQFPGFLFLAADIPVVLDGQLRLPHRLRRRRVQVRIAGQEHRPGHLRPAERLGVRRPGPERPSSRRLDRGDQRVPLGHPLLLERFPERVDPLPLREEPPVPLLRGEAPPGGPSRTAAGRRCPPAGGAGIPPGR